MRADNKVCTIHRGAGVDHRNVASSDAGALADLACGVGGGCGVAEGVGCQPLGDHGGGEDRVPGTSLG